MKAYKVVSKIRNFVRWQGIRNSVIQIPQDLGQVTPFGCAPGNTEFTLYQGDFPVGDYEIYMDIDFINNGYLDLYDNNLVYDHLLIHVVQ